VPKEELGPYREEFLQCGYTHMVGKYRISRGDLKRLLGRKPRPVTNPFYRELSDETTFLRLREEYYATRTEDFARKYRIGVRQARKTFGVKQWHRIRHEWSYEKKPPPVEVDRSEVLPYWKREDYWQARGVV
jgi:hypothetical protein